MNSSDLFVFLSSCRKAVVFNMDPANESVPYEAAVNISELINARKVAEDLSLGPNGSLLYAMEYLEKNISWLLEKVNQHKKDYILFDFPGQVELYTHNECIRSIVQILVRKGHRVRCHVENGFHVELFITALCLNSPLTLRPSIIPYILKLYTVACVIHFLDHCRQSC